MRPALLAVAVLLLACAPGAAAREPGSAGTVQRGVLVSSALRGPGSYLAYLPAGYRTSGARYPVLYLLHGSDSRAGSFLSMGLQGTLDRLIAERSVPPMIAIMIQGGPGENDWLNTSAARYEDYALDVQALVDEAFRTIADRSGRAIAGYSMGGFGAVNIALGHPELFSMAESWSGFFDGLTSLADAHRPQAVTLPLRVILYGGSRDAIVSPAQNAPFAARLRADGVAAGAAIYPGAHTLSFWAAHLPHMLELAGQALRAAR